MADEVPARSNRTPELRIDARRNQQRILRAAARLLAEDPTVSIQRIADEAEVARPTVYRRYPTRETLLAAILTEAMAEFRSAVARLDEDDRDAASVTRELIHTLAVIASSYPILLADYEGRPPRGTDPHGGLQGHALDVADEFDALIARGQRDGVIRADITPSILRHSVLGALAMSLRSTHQPVPEISPSRIADEVGSIILDGIRPRHPESS